MVSFTTCLSALAIVTSVLASPTSLSLSKRNSPNAQGTNNGYWYQFWDDGTKGNAVYTNGPAGQYSVTWTNVGDFTSGKGWNTATNRIINFSGTVSASGNFYLAVYTWSQKGENYILENYGTYNPCNDGTNMGTLNSDGSDYQVCLVDRGNNYLQNWSVRKNKRSSGTVTTANHYNYYASHGMTHNPLSAAAYQIVSTEGYGSSGSATITVSEGTASGTAPSSAVSSPPSSTTKTTAVVHTSTATPPPSGSCSALYGQCGGSGYSGATCCSSGACKFSNAWYSQCL